MQDIYQDGTYEKNNETWHIEDSPWKASQIETLIKRNQLSFNSVVEVGCGAGGILYELSKKFPQVNFEGFDISQQASQLWYKIPEAKINFVMDDFLLTHKQYDLLLLIDVFEHIPDYLGFLHSLSRRAKYFIFNIPLDMHIIGIMLDHQIYARKKYGHLHYFSKATALKTLEESGYIVVDNFLSPGFAGAPPESSRKTIKQKIIYPLRKVLFHISPELNAKLLGGVSLMVLAKQS